MGAAMCKAMGEVVCSGAGTGGRGGVGAEARLAPKVVGISVCAFTRACADARAGAEAAQGVAQLNWRMSRVGNEAGLDGSRPPPSKRAIQSRP